MAEGRGRGRQRYRKDSEGIDTGSGVERGNEERPFTNYRWKGKATTNAFVTPSSLPISTVILNSFTSEQVEVYTLVIRLDQINRMFQVGEFELPDERDRSVSPEPIYDNFGKRKNTREIRFRKKMDDERHLIVERLLKVIPDYVIPDWYKIKPTKIVEKLYIKSEEYPDINFIGLLIGPRGNTLKQLQTESGARIGIRGKGSVKVGRNMNISSELNNLNDKLHCEIIADSQEKVDTAKRLCQEVMDKAIYSPVGANDLKRNQLRELAMLNGTFRDDSNRPCGNCGEIGHTKANCKYNGNGKPNFTNSLICEKCNNVGHLEKDCKFANKEINDKMDKEFEDFMADLNDEDEDDGEVRVKNVPPPPPPPVEKPTQSTLLPPPPPPIKPSQVTAVAQPPPPGKPIKGPPPPPPPPPPPVAAAAAAATTTFEQSIPYKRSYTPEYRPHYQQQHQQQNYGTYKKPRYPSNNHDNYNGNPHGNRYGYDHGYVGNQGYRNGGRNGYYDYGAYDGYYHGQNQGYGGDYYHQGQQGQGQQGQSQEQGQVQKQEHRQGQGQYRRGASAVPPPPPTKR